MMRLIELGATTTAAAAKRLLYPSTLGLRLFLKYNSQRDTERDGTKTEIN